MQTPSANVPTARSRSNPVWPLSVLFIGLPIWWLLGVWEILFFVMAIPMVSFLVKRRTIEMPRGFWMWLLWIGWLLTGLLVLQVDAPGTVPGVNMNRYLVFSYRFGWYVAATIVALYVLNTRHVLTTEKLMRTMAWFFVMLVGGGMLGLIAPDVSFPSVLQALLPHGLATNPLIHAMTHVQTAQIHSFLGDPLPRPSAPFPYTNDWGFALALTMPMFVAAWWPRGTRWRIGMIVVLGLAFFAVVSSLNRGTWLAIVAVALLATVRSVMRGRIFAVLGAACVAVIATMLFFGTPLGELVSSRLETGHSDEGRQNLALTALETTAQGSPVVGFGTTRNLAGNFNSIAGGASDACPGCEPPPLGTHGQLWAVTFTTGFVGVALYAGFFGTQFLRNVRTQSIYGTAALASLAVMLVTMPIYNAVGVRVYLGFIAIGVLARECRLPLSSLQEAVRPIFRNAPTFAAFALTGALLGVATDAVLGSTFVATQRVLVPTAELSPVPGVRSSTLDAEAVLATSDGVVSSISLALDIPVHEAREALSIGAEPNTRVMLVTYRADSAEDARQGVEAAASTYLSEREAHLQATADAVRVRYTNWRGALDEVYRESRPFAESTQSAQSWGTLNRISREWAQVSGVLSDSDDIASARAVSNIQVVEATSGRTVRIASGLAIGALLGVPLILLYDRHFLRLGRSARHRDRAMAPVVANMPPRDPRRAGRVMRTYAPLAGVLADPASARAMRLAAKVDNMSQKGGYAGSRVLVLVEPDARVGHVNAMIKHLKSCGLDPVGLIVCERGLS